MPGRKRALEDPFSSRNTKKVKTESSKKRDKFIVPSRILAEDVDFPRGGGTSFTPLEVKAFRAEAVKEANAELFTVSLLLQVQFLYQPLTLKEDDVKKSKKKKAKPAAKPATSSQPSGGRDKIRIEHLNYKVS